MGHVTDDRSLRDYALQVALCQVLESAAGWHHALLGEVDPVLGQVRPRRVVGTELALDCKEFVRLVDSLPAGEQPIGWAIPDSLDGIKAFEDGS